MGAFSHAADLLDPPKAAVLDYYDDPAGFVRDCFKWPEGKGPTAYQLRNLDALIKHGRIAIRGPHGLGKTATNAWLILWFALTRDAAGDDWKVPTTASAWRQLTKFLWPEVHKWARKLDWTKLDRDPFDERYELQTLNLKLKTGEAFAVASNDPATIEGAHADQVLYIYDEAKTIPAETYDASEGAFSGAGPETDNAAYAIASSTPGPPAGRFFEIHQRKAGLEDWKALRVTLTDTVKAGRVSRTWAKQRGKQWGKTSAVYLNRVEGEFASSDEDSVIPLAWIEAAVERWHELEGGFGSLDAIGVDVARSGPDKTVFARRHGNAISRLERKSKQGTMETAGQVVAAIRGTDAEPIVDVIGIGAGVVDRVRELDLPVVAFNAAAKTERQDSSGELGFVNARAAAWWYLRELLDPDSDHRVALPDDDQLTGDLTAPRWKVMSGGRIQIESKDEIKKRIGRSTDDGDAVVQAFWPGEPVKNTSWRPL